MNKNIMIVGVMVVVLIIAGGAWYLVSRNHTAGTTATKTTQSTNQSTDTNTPSTAPTPTATNAVTIQNFAFTPADITVKMGTTVTWTNQDSFAHTVTETDGQTGPNSSDVAPNGTYTFTFMTPGTYHYHCSIHSEMTGTVVVTG